jgi:Flp pilus assembly protein TadG
VRSLRRPTRGPAARNDAGASSVEFALVVPIFLALVFGIMYFGFIFAQNLALGNAARQGARAAVVNNTTCSSIVSEVQQASSTIGLSDTTAVAVTVQKRKTDGTLVAACPNGGTVPCQGSATGESIFVKAIYANTMTFPFAPPKIRAGGEGEFRCEFK